MVPLKVESWIWYAVVVFITGCRLLSRALNFGSIKRLQVDDWLILFCLIPYTALIVTINIVAHTSSNLIAPGEDIATFTPQDIKSRIYGSKLILVVEQMQCATVWLLKGCFIILYYRLTVNLSANIVVKILAGYMVLTFIVMEILYFAVWCRPFHNYWALPTPNTQCSTATHHLITNATFNISSDLVMLGIGPSLFIRSSLPLNRKLILSCIFSLGIFVILASVLNKYYSFTHPFGSQWTYWYVRESSTAFIVANLPFLWTLLRRVFKLNSFDEDGSRVIPYHSSRTARGRHVTSSPRHSRRQDKNSSNKHSKQGSQNSEMADIRDYAPSSPKKAPEIPKPAKRASWREQGVFGRDDIDCMAIDPWDAGNDADATILETSRENSREPPAERDGRCTNGSPTSMRHSRRIRDEEAQYALEEDVGAHCHFYEGPGSISTSISPALEVASPFEEIEEEDEKTGTETVETMKDILQDNPASPVESSEKQPEEEMVLADVGSLLR